jgi:hypothetical protein
MDWDDNSADNIFTVNEHYKILNIWETDKKNSKTEVYLYPQDVAYYLNLVFSRTSIIIIYVPIPS